MHGQTAGYLGTTQSAGATHPHTLGAGLYGPHHHLLHRPPKGNTAFNLFGYSPGYQIGVKLRLLNFQNIQLDLLADKLLEENPHLINPLPAAPDDDARPGGMDIYRYLIGLAFNLDCGNGGIRVPGLNCLA